MKYILGFDPGMHGAMACINLSTEESSVTDFPLLKFKKHKIVKGKKKLVNVTEYNIQGLADLIAPLRKDIKGLNEDAEVFAQVEDVGSRTGQGIISIWTFAKGVGIIEGILGAYKIPMLKSVIPQSWKTVCVPDFNCFQKEARNIRKDNRLTELDLKELKKQRDKDIKELELQTAKELFPKLASSLSLTRDGRTDALLIANYGGIQLLKDTNKDAM